MKQKYTILDEAGNERRITGIKHPGWTGMGEPCPFCGGEEYRHFETGGGRYGMREDALILRSDYWDANKRLYTQCLDCREILYKHPAFDLLFGDPECDEDLSLGF